MLHPRKVMKGVVAGVRDYGNRMGIPTVNGAVCFDERYLGNPLVFCGTVGLIPVDRCHKEAQAGRPDRGRRRPHRPRRHPRRDVLLDRADRRIGEGQRRRGADRQRHHREEAARRAAAGPRRAACITPSPTAAPAASAPPSARWARSSAPSCDLDKAPLKYEGLSYTEIWISEVAGAHGPGRAAGQLAALAGAVRQRGRRGDGPRHASRRPAGCGCRIRASRSATSTCSSCTTAGRRWCARRRGEPRAYATGASTRELRSLRSRLARTTSTRRCCKSSASLNVCSKEWIIRQYDHEVQGGSVIKPLVGVARRRPRRRRGGDAGARLVDAAWRSAAASTRITATSTPTAMAAAAIDEAVRNVVAVGADPARIALLDNFCWGNTDRPEVLGSLVRAAEACRDVALAYGMPFISGKDSLNNEFHAGGRHIVIPPTLLISALGRVPDVRRCVTMDLKEPGNLLYPGRRRPGTRWAARTSTSCTGSKAARCRRSDLNAAPRLFRALHRGDPGRPGARLPRPERGRPGGGRRGDGVRRRRRRRPDLFGEVRLDLTDEALLFSESTTRFLVEVKPEHGDSFQQCLGAFRWQIGKTCKEPRLRIAGTGGEWLVWAKLAELKEAWQKPLRF